MKKLTSMFLVLGTIIVSGVGVYQLAVLKPEYAVGDAIDAGLLPLTVPARLSCRVRIYEECRNGGARPKYARLGMKARKSKPVVIPTAVSALFPDGGMLQQSYVVFDLPNAWMPCFMLAGTVDEACDLLEDGTCTLPAVCAANADPQIEVDACACRPAAGVCTQLDGGALPFGATIPAGQWTGAACVRKYCGPEIAGEQGGSWPAGCPL